MKSIEVTFCKANLVRGSIFTFNRLKKQQSPLVTVKAVDCIGYCGRCISQFFAKVDQEVLQEQTPDELFEKIFVHVSIHLSQDK